MISLLISAAISFSVAILFTPIVIKILRDRNIGQFIQEEVEGHSHKHGTPTMGGIVLILAVLVGYLASHLELYSISGGFQPGWLPLSPGGMLALMAFVGMGSIGLIDDYQKVSKERNLGLNKRSKFFGQLVIAGLFAWGAVEAGVQPEISVVRSIGLTLPLVLFGVWVLVMLSGAANAVNITDGLDGLASGSGAMVFGAYTIITFWIFRQPDFYGTEIALELSALDLARFSAALLGATLGFLWWNSAPAKIFMGDVGSQSLGGAMAALALLTNTHLLLVVLGGLYVMETVTVILQVASFRLFGRRIFKMTPIHHAFEIRGWPETTIIVRFWILAGLGVAFGLGLFYGDFVSNAEFIVNGS